MTARAPMTCALTLWLGCGSYSDGLIERPEPPTTVEDVVVEPASELPMPSPEPQEMAMERAPSSPAIEESDVKLAQSADLDGYLTDASGRALYMLADDLPASGKSACLGACAREWPPFDSTTFRAAAGIAADELQRFHRQDGSFQISYKGYPLYYHASEQNPHGVVGDGAEGRFFVARDYLVFYAPFTDLTSASSGSSERFLTDGFGRTLYLCLDDAPGDASRSPVSSCLGECAEKRPPWDVTSTLRSTAVPSSLAAHELGSYVRSDGRTQLTFRGWPLYLFRGDELLGKAAGHNQRAWRAIDPR